MRIITEQLILWVFYLLLIFGALFVAPKMLENFTKPEPTKALDLKNVRL